MKSIKAASVLFSIMALTALGYTNCSKVAVSDLSSEKVSSGGFDGNGGDVAVNPPVVPVDPRTLKATCDNARAMGKMRSQKVSAAFPNPGQTCKWGQDGNLSIKDGYVRARIEQLQNFQISTAGKSTICNIKLNSQREDNFFYDDNILVTLNGFILASTTDFSRHFQSQNGYRKYSWEALVGQAAQNNQTDSTPDKQYCAGASQSLSSCLFPQTERYGAATFQIGENVIQSILSMTNTQTFTLGVITTGDNDSTDCQHVAIDLDVDIDYILE